MLIDLQIHSTYSDGYLTPEQAAQFLKNSGVKAASLTDHNTVGGQHEFIKACGRLGIKAVPGLELYAKLGGKKFNILWYNLDYHAPQLHDLLRGSQRRRRKIFRACLQRMADKGFSIRIDEILDRYDHYVPINRVIDDILSDKKNSAKIKKELGTSAPREEQIISSYLQHSQIGKLQNSYVDISRIFNLRKRIGGQIVLCHPGKYGYLRESFLSKLKQSGLDGIEVLSPHHSYNAVVYMQYLARNHRLIESGGSDFHRFENGKEPIQKSWDYFRIDSDLLRGVHKIIS